MGSMEEGGRKMKPWPTLLLLTMAPVFSPFPAKEPDLTNDQFIKLFGYAPENGIVTVEIIDGQKVRVFTAYNDPLIERVEYPVWR